MGAASADMFCVHTGLTVALQDSHFVRK